ncbi:DUF5658 family protein [Aneurinibacillus aneurinilyticus]|jgi:hypothetical protein|uniref:DUF5658 family protein n=1 Tax=Aneurinibacillus aneurinilyticus TaxID=1391 RepID=UPI003C6C6C6A
MIRTVSLYQRFIFYLFILNITDWYFTSYGIQNNYIEEANPLLSSIFSTNPLLALIWKCMGPLILFSLMPYCQSGWVRHALLFTVCLYIMVNVYHLLFFFFFFFFFTL